MVCPFCFCSFRFRSTSVLLPLCMKHDAHGIRDSVKSSTANVTPSDLLRSASLLLPSCRRNYIAGDVRVRVRTPGSLLGSLEAAQIRSPVLQIKFLRLFASVSLQFSEVFDCLPVCALRRLQAACSKSEFGVSVSRAAAELSVTVPRPRFRVPMFLPLRFCSTSVLFQLCEQSDL